MLTMMIIEKKRKKKKFAKISTEACL